MAEDKLREKAREVWRALVECWPVFKDERPEDIDAASAILETALREVAQDARRAALVEADGRVRANADSLYKWMLKLPLHSDDRKDKSFRAGEIFRIADQLRAMAEEVPHERS